MWVENIARGAIVQDNRVANRPAQLREVLDVVALVVEAALAEQPMCNDAVRVEFVQNWVRVLL